MVLRLAVFISCRGTRIYIENCEERIKSLQELDQHTMPAWRFQTIANDGTMTEKATCVRLRQIIKVFDLTSTFLNKKEKKGERASFDAGCKANGLEIDFGKQRSHKSNWVTEERGSFTWELNGEKYFVSAGEGPRSANQHS